MPEFAHDQIGEHLISIHHNAIDTAVRKGKPTSRAVLGEIKKGEAESIFPKIGGPEFDLIYSQNTHAVAQKGADVVGGFCFLSRGLVTASKTVVDKRGRKKRIQIDLMGRLPKPLFPDVGIELTKKNHRQLGGARLNKRGWRVEAPGKGLGVPLEVHVKAMRYFEIARANSGKLTLIIPTMEYGSSVAPNAKELGVSGKKARRAVYEIGEEYASDLKRLGKEFFPDVQLEVILTHDAGFQRKLNELEEKHATEFAQANTRLGDDFLPETLTEKQKDKLRNFWSEETKHELRMFTYIFSRKTPTILGLHARDFLGLPLEGLDLARKIVGVQQIRENVGFVGVTGGPAVSTQIQPRLIAMSTYGQDTKKFEGAVHARSADRDQRLDGYFALPNQRASTNYLPERLGGSIQGKKVLELPAGKCAFWHYVRNIGPYVDVVPEGASVKAIRRCWHNKSHDECRRLFLETYRRFSRRLKPTRAA